MAFTILPPAETSEAPKKGFTILPPAEAEKAFDPTEGMSFGGKMLAGGGKALVDLYRGGKQLLGVGDQEALQREIDESRRLDAPLMDTAGGVIGNLAGNVAATAIPGGLAAKGAMAVPKIAAIIEAATAARPITTAMGLGAGSGAGIGAFEPVETGGSRGKNIAAGAAIGAAGGAIPGALARVVKPNTSDDAARLIEEGVRLTPGQTLGGAAKRIEDSATSIPVVGDFIRNAQRRGVEDFNRAGFNRALAPIGEQVGKDFKVGREGIAEVESKIGSAYDQVLSKIKRVDLDDTFSQEVSKVASMTDELGEGVQKQFTAILQHRVLDKMTPAGTMSAETMKRVESELGQQARMWSGSADAKDRGLASAIREVQASLRRNVERSAGPELAGDLQQVNSAWANFVRLQDAAARIGSKDGVFTPAQLTAATRAKDSSGRKAAFARGDALMQDLAESGKNILPSSVPDSGSASRIFTGGGLGAMVGHGIGLDPATMAMAATGVLPYTAAGGKLTLAMLAKRPEFAGTLAEILRAGAPAGALFAGGSAPLLTGP